MMVTQPVLVPVIVVFPGFMIQEAGCPGLSGKNISTMALILEDAADGACCPLRIPQFGLSSVLR